MQCREFPASVHCEHICMNVITHSRNAHNLRIYDSIQQIMRIFVLCRRALNVRRTFVLRWPEWNLDTWNAQMPLL